MCVRSPERASGRHIDAYRIMCADRLGSPTASLCWIPRHPSLGFKRVSQRSPVYSVRVSIDYRALGVMDHGDIVWFWIGAHHEYDRLLARR